MARKDIYHNQVREALRKDNWQITDDPFRLRIGKKRLAMDLGAEQQLLTAEKGLRKIDVIRLLVFDEVQEAIVTWIPD